jgi:2-dehydro-3-deoxyphosphooctonate aldolase (KDO 8-P synthase)
VQKEVNVGRITFGKRPFVFIGGPCVIEGREITLRIAERLLEITSALHIPFVFKSSYDKANRTSISSFRGPGLTEGLRILKEVKERTGVPILTDVHSPEEAEKAAQVADVLQVPALLSRQTDLLVACGKTGQAVNIKKGQFLYPSEIRYALEKVESTGNSRILVTERGTFFGYNTLVNDFRALPLMRGLGYPVVFDATHSVQMPGAASGASGGEREFVFPLAKAAVAVGVDAIFMEVHEEPDRARCDGANSVELDSLAAMLATLRRIEDAL